MRWLWVVAVATGCATAPAIQKVPFEDAMGWKRPAATRSMRVPGALPSTGLQRALADFSSQAQQTRQATPSGAPMPARHAADWSQLLDATDGYLALPLGKASVLDGVRARLSLETELDADRQRFGDVPPALAERITTVMGRLSARLTALASRQRRANPKAFRWPVSPLVVSSPFGHRVHPLNGEYRFHAGIDLEAESAQPVYAADSGFVVFSGWNGAHGKQVELQHDAHLSTRYSHLMTLLVAPGRRVKKGDLLGLVGATGAVTGPHLHFELRKDGLAVDPEVLMPSTMPSSLVLR